MVLLRKVIAVAAVFALVLAPLGALAETTDELNISAEVDQDNAGTKVNLEWKDYSYEGKAFKVYRSSDRTNFETVGVDFSKDDPVRVLQIYSAVPQLKSWLIDSGYSKDGNGENCITVFEVDVNTFSGNPSNYLNKDSEGHWNYDVIYIGAWDGYRNSYGRDQDLGDNAYKVIHEYMLDGKGIIFGHDTIGTTATKAGKGNIGKLATEILPEITSGGASGAYFSSVVISRNSVFTQYPNNIGPKGTVLSIPTTHPTGQICAQQDKYAYIMADRGSATSTDPYLYVKGNAAFIQTGHSNGAAKPDEQKVIANLCFFLNQVVYDEHSFTDPSAFDEASPNTPTASVTPDGVATFTSKDNGTTYTYYVESYNKGSMATPVATSNTETVESVSGLKGFVYTCDNAANTEIKNATGMKNIEENEEIDILANAGKNAYFHIAAIDGVGNVSKTKTISVAEVFKKKYEEVLDKTTADRTDREAIEEVLEALDELGDDVKEQLKEEKKKLDELEEEAVFDDDVSTFIEEHASKINGKKIKKKEDITNKVAQKIVDGEQVWSDLTPEEQDEVNRRLAPLTYETLLKYAKARLVPETGDNTDIALLAMLMLVALTGVILTGARKRSNN